MWKKETASSITVVADGLCANIDRPVQHRGHLEVKSVQRGHFNYVYVLVMNINKVFETERLNTSFEKFI